ncbi:hypothetical protein HRbin01_01331 [archaeon HR01]|nr:hypothetical protein HRbin01_01331 [archaeon HR01]
MCGICGELQSYIHWAERVPWEESELAESGGGMARSLQRLRIRRAAVVAKLLSAYGLEFSLWQGGKYILSDRKGGTAVINDMAQLWPAIHRILGKPFDPLDPKVLERIRAGGTLD